MKTDTLYLGGKIIWLEYSKIGFTFKISSLQLKRKSRKVTKEFENSDLCQLCLRINYYFDNFFKWYTSMSVCSLLKWNGTF